VQFIVFPGLVDDKNHRTDGSIAGYNLLYIADRKKNINVQYRKYEYITEDL
jgi:hypothetical protein